MEGAAVTPTAALSLPCLTPTSQQPGWARGLLGCLGYHSALRPNPGSGCCVKATVTFVCFLNVHYFKTRMFCYWFLI